MALNGLIVGLGNPGDSYVGTRHNLGFICTAALLESMENVVSLSGGKFRALLWKGAFPQVPGEWLIANPQTFMNLSGDCVQPLAAWHRIDPERILVIHDELDLPVGRMKFKRGGGDAGHNGLKSITQRLGTPNYYRLRLGTGKPKSAETINWVLGKPSQQEREALQRIMPAACECVRAFAEGSPEKATRLANGYREEQ